MSIEQPLTALKARLESLEKALSEIKREISDKEKTKDPSNRFVIIAHGILPPGLSAKARSAVYSKADSWEEVTEKIDAAVKELPWETSLSIRDNANNETYNVVRTFNIQKETSQDA